MSSDFYWNTDDLVVRRQDAIAVRGDEKGNVSIRQGDHFLDISRVHVVSLFRAILREAGLHHLGVAVLDEVQLQDREGNPLRIKASQSAALATDFEKLDMIAEEERLERVAARIPWERQSRAKPKDPTAAERQRRHRAAKRDCHSVTDRDRHGEFEPRDLVVLVAPSGKNLDPFKSQSEDTFAIEVAHEAPRHAQVGS